MSVIITEIVIPKTCYRCEFCREDDQLRDYCSISYDGIWHGEKERLKDCPLKSVEELVEKIEQLPSIQDSEGQDRYMAYDVLRTIKEYCEVKE